MRYKNNGFVTVSTVEMLKNDDSSRDWFEAPAAAKGADSGDIGEMGGGVGWSGDGIKLRKFFKT